MRPRELITALIILFSVQLGACATPGPVLTESVGTIRTGLTLARQQSETAFAATNTAARDIDIQRAIENPLQNLREADFPLALAPEDIQKWSNAFTALDAYLGALQRLVAPERAAATGNNLDDLASQLREGAVGLSLPAEASAAFSTFASALVQASAERRAIDVMRRVDPQFTQVMAGLADAIGENDRAGLRQTSRLYWEGKLSSLRVAYSQVEPSARDRRRAVIDQFLRTIDTRNAQLASLGQLRASLLGLGEAHSAAARGDNGSAQFWIGRISGWLDDIKRRTAAAAAEQGDNQ